MHRTLVSLTCALGLSLAALPALAAPPACPPGCVPASADCVPGQAGCPADGKAMGPRGMRGGMQGPRAGMQGQRGGMQGGMMALGAEHMQRMFRALDLTDAQQTQIKAIHKKHVDGMKAQRESLQTKRQEMYQLMRDPKATRDQAIARHREVQALQQQLMEDSLAGWFEARALLTPEQLKKLETMKAGKGQRRGMGLH